jgi:hypothetical protein
MYHVGELLLLKKIWTSSKPLSELKKMKLQIEVHDLHLKKVHGLPVCLTHELNLTIKMVSKEEGTLILSFSKQGKHLK